MAAPRSVQFIALRNLSRGTHQVRNLHMTGPATYASNVLTKERPSMNLPHDIASLRNECKRRKIDFNGNKQDLISRLSADEITSSRAFSTAVAQSKRPTTLEQQKADSTSTSVRHFNTSRALKSVNDSSTIDLTFLPEFEANSEVSSNSLLMRVPILPDTFSPARTSAHALEPEAAVARAEIVSASPFSIVLPMADSHDGHADGMDFHAVTDFMTAVKKPVEAQVGVVKELWNSMLDDVMGASSSKRASTA